MVTSVATVNMLIALPIFPTKLRVKLSIGITPVPISPQPNAKKKSITPILSGHTFLASYILRGIKNVTLLHYYHFKQCNVFNASQYIFIS